MPIGVPISVASATISSAADDGVGQAAAVGLRRRRHLGEQRQRQAGDAQVERSSTRIQTSQNRPKAIAASDSVRAIRLIELALR